MKLKALTLTIAAAAAMPHGAFAAGLDPTGAFDVILRVAGASAEDNLIFDGILKDICAGNISVLNKPDTTATPHKLGNYFGVACTAKSASPVDPTIQGKNILITKRSAGGSAYGVNTLLTTPPAAITQIDRTTCVANGTYSNPNLPSVGTVANYTCGNTTAGVSDTAADVGVSDVNPEMFRGINAPLNSTGGKQFPDVVASDSAAKFGKVKGVVAQVFGIVVSTNLRNALQTAQASTLGAGCVGQDTAVCMPSLSKQLVASILSGQVTDWAGVQVNGTPLSNVAGVVKPTTTTMKICRRTQGSGTQATINQVVFNNPCSASGGVPLSANNANVALGSGSSDVDKCMGAWNNATTATIATDAGTGSITVGVAGTSAWAVGLMGLEKASANFKFIKLDGIAPTLKNAHDGLYPLWAEATMQYRVDTASGFALTGPKLALANSLRNVMSSPSNLATLNSLLPNPAYLALSTNVVPDAVYKASNPVIGFTHTTTNTDACRPIQMNKAHKTKTPLGF